MNKRRKSCYPYPGKQRTLEVQHSHSNTYRQNKMQFNYSDIEAFDSKHTRPKTTGSGRKKTQRRSGKLKTVRGTGKMEPLPIEQEPNMSNNAVSKQGPPPGAKPKKSWLDVLKSPSLNVFKRKPKTSKLQVPGKPRQKKGLMATISRSVTSFKSMLGFGKKKPPPPPKPKPKPPPPKPAKSRTLSVSPPPSEDKKPSATSLPPAESERVLKVTDYGKSPSKKVSNMLTKSVIENIAKEVNKITSERRRFDDLMCERKRRTDLCDRCLQCPPVPARMIVMPPTEFAGPLCTAPYPRRGIMELTRPVSPFAMMAPYSMPIQPPFHSPSQALFPPPPHFPPYGPPPFPRFSPYPGGAMPFGFHPGMPPMHNPFTAPYRNSAARTWPRPPWPNPGFGFPKSPCELNPALCQSNFPICPCGCGRPVAGPSFYR